MVGPSRTSALSQSHFPTRPHHVGGGGGGRRRGKPRIIVVHNCVACMCEERGPDGHAKIMANAWRLRASGGRAAGTLNMLTIPPPKKSDFAIGPRSCPRRVQNRISSCRLRRFSWFRRFLRSLLGCWSVASDKLTHRQYMWQNSAKKAAAALFY